MLLLFRFPIGSWRRVHFLQIFIIYMHYYSLLLSTIRTFPFTLFSSESVRVVIVESTQLTTTLTPCPRSQWIRWHGVRLVNNYTDTVSAWSTTTLTTCPRSQRLRWQGVIRRHAVFENIKLNFVLLFIVGFFLSKII